MNAKSPAHARLTQLPLDASMLRKIVTLSAFGVLSVACDDSPPPTSASYTMTFVNPTEGAALSCADDQRRDTPTLIDRDVVLEVEVPADERVDLIVELSAEGASWSPQRRGVPINGEVSFADLPFADGNYTLSAALINADETRAEVSANVSVTIDEADPLCATSSTSLAFLNLVDAQTLSAADDLDADLSNGLQVRAEVEVQGPLLNDIVELQVNGVPQRATSVRNGVALFEQLTLPAPQAEPISAAVTALAQSPNGLIEASVSLNIEAGACSLTLSPEPVEGCDLSAVNDLDPSVPGVQTTLRASTECAQVVWVVNGVTYPPAEVVGGEAAINVTLTEGENSVSASARSAEGLVASAPTYTLDVNATAPQVAFDGLNALTEARFGLSEASEVLSEGAEGRARWTLTGYTSHVEEGALVTLTAEPALEGLAAEVSVDAQGRFELPIEAGYRCGQVITPSVTDPCGGVHAGEPYTLCFDAVRPSLTLSTPYQDDLILAHQDVDEAREGVQVYLPVRVEDSREEIDYPIEVACRLSGSTSFVVVSDEPRLKSALSAVEGEPNARAGALLITLPTLGRYECVAQANTGLNQPNTPVLSLRVFEVAPIFQLIDPTPVSDEPVCASSALRIGGLATDIDPQDVSLRFTLTNASGEVARQGSLSPLSGGYFGAQVAVGANGLADGRYTLNVTGVSAGVEVTVRPASAEVVVSSSAPNLGVSSPEVGLISAERAAELDSDGDLNNCLQAPIVLALTDPGASELCYSWNRALPTCLPLSAEALEAGQVTLPERSFIEGENSLELTLKTCSAPEGETQVSASFTYDVQGCEPVLRLTRPASGTWVTPSDDIDNVRAGTQLNVTIKGAPNEEVTLTLTNAAGDELSVSEPVSLNEQGLAPTVVTLPQTFEERELTLTPRSDREGLSISLSQRLSELSFELTPVGGAEPSTEACLSALTPDISIQTGFQARFTASGSGVSDALAPVLSVSCDGPAGSSTQRVEGSLSQPQAGVSFVEVSFPPLTLSAGTCTATATAEMLNGETFTSELSFEVDREAPTAQLNSPSEQTVLTLSQDLDPLVDGLQTNVLIEVCGAAGRELSLAVPNAEAPLTLTLPEQGDDCQLATFSNVTLSGLAQPLTLSVSDACGNALEQTFFVSADTTPLLSIVSPQDNATLAINSDLDRETVGCQLTLSATSTGGASSQGLEVVVCSDQEGGEASPLCGAELDISEGSCEAIDAQGRELRCDVTLRDGAHNLTLVTRSNGVIARSESISVYADCSAPVTEEVVVLQDSDANGCVNSLERANPTSPSLNAAVQVRYSISGLLDGAQVTLRERLTGLALAQSLSQGGQGLFENISLAPGSHELYLTARDLANNPIAGPDEVGFVSRVVRVDTQAPQPQLVRPSADICLNSGDDLDQAAAGLQMSPELLTGGDGTDVMSVRLSVDGREVQRLSTTLTDVTLEPIQLNQGAHSLSAVVYDSCGNAGSVAGFATDAGLPVWGSPQSVPVSVDVLAPSLELVGLSSGAVFTEADDADQDPSNGFQIDLNVLTSGLEAGRQLIIASGESQLTTQPAQLIVTGSGPQLLPVRVTLPPGLHALNAKASDACGNEAQSAPVGVTVDISGCASALLNLSANQAIGPNLGAVEAGGVRLDLEGRVDLFDPACEGASVSLMSDEVSLATSVVQPGGAVSFPAVLLPEGSQRLSLNVTAGGDSTSSLGLTVRVDASAPTLAFSTPASNAQGQLLALTDEDPSSPNSQEVSFELSVSEALVVTPRSATLSIDGAPVREGLALAQGSNITARFSGVTVPNGESSVEVCVSDEASNQACVSATLIADLSAPTPVTASVTVGDQRAPEVEVSFASSTDDLNGGGPVQRYRMRWSRTVINNGDEGAWSAATALPPVDASAGVGGQEVVNLDGRLPINEVTYLAVRAEDDQGRLSEVRAVQVDTRLPRASYVIPSASGAAWAPAEGLFNTTNGVLPIGDFNGDGFPDVIASANQLSGAYASAVLFGGPDLTALTIEQLGYSANLAFQASGATALGDVNGDGAPDLAVLSYISNFSGAEVSIYFGCPTQSPCATSSAQLLSPDVSLSFVGAFRNFISGGGDVDGDGLNDLIVGGDGGGGSSSVNVVLGRAVWPQTLDGITPSLANGVLALEVPGLFNAGLYSSIVGDLDEDGRDEVIFSGGGDIDRTFLFYGEGVGLAGSAAISYTGAEPYFIELSTPCAPAPINGVTSAFGSFFAGGDVNGDGRADLLIGNRINKQLVVMDADLNRLDCFSRPESGFGTTFALMGDFNGDGNPDLIANHSDSGSTRAMIFFNDGFGAFGADAVQSPRAISVRLLEPNRFKLAVNGAQDLNADGRDDVVYLTWSAAGELELSTLY